MKVYSDGIGSKVVYKKFLGEKITITLSFNESEADIRDMMSDLYIDPTDINNLLGQLKIITLYETLSFAGTNTGTITPPPGSQILENYFGAGVAITSGVQGGFPNFKTPDSADGGGVTATIDALGNVTLSENYTGDISIIYGASITYEDYSLLSGIYTSRIIDSDVYADGNYIKQEEFVISGADPLPVISNDTKVAYIDIQAMTADYDITGWSASNLDGVCDIIIRKIDDSPYKITFSDGVVDYKFIDLKGEYISLKFNNNQLKIN
jgi:hypothetical protein